VRQYTSELKKEPTLLKIFSGSNGRFVLYDDDGISQDYLTGKGNWTAFSWDEKKKELTIEPGVPMGFKNEIVERTFNVQLVPGNEIRTVVFNGKSVKIKF